MPDQKKKEILNEPQEEFIEKELKEEGISRTSDSKEDSYENMQIEELHRQARLKGVENYIEMDRDELIKKLKAQN